MRKIGLAIVPFLAGCAPQAPLPASEGPIAEIAGRVAGQPQRCIPTQQTEGLRPANRTTLVSGNGKTVWVNRVQHQCSGFSRWDVLVMEPIGSQYCRGDLVRSVDPVSRIPGAACQLGDFVPYTRP
jgi:hypothetical protein